MEGGLAGFYQPLFLKLGIGEPIPRALVGAAIFSIPLLLKSNISYKTLDDGNVVPKQFSLFASDEIKGLGLSTHFPWYIFPLLGATIFGLFL